MNNAEKTKLSNTWYNYIIHSMEGGFYMFGLTFVAVETIMPPIVKTLGGPSWLISAMPIMLMLGFMSTPLFSAHKVEKLYQYKPFILILGIFQRIPYLLAALALIYLAKSYPILTLTSVALAPLFSGMIGGVGITAWQGIIIKTIPPNRRSSLMAVRNIISTTVGIGAGGIITLILNKYPGTHGYGMLHLITFGFLCLSYLSFAMIKEDNTKNIENKETYGFIDNMKRIPELITSDKQLVKYILSRTFINGIYIFIPFLSIHALDITNRSESYLGYFVTAHMVGGIFGNVMAGYLGDKFGGKSVMIVSGIAFLGVCIISIIASSPLLFIITFFLYGIAMYGNKVGTMIFSMEISPEKDRATYLALIAVSTIPSMIIASIISSIIWSHNSNYLPLASTSGVFILISLYYLLRIKEVRNNG